MGSSSGESVLFYGIPQMWGVVKFKFMIRLESGSEQMLCVENKKHIS